MLGFREFLGVDGGMAYVGEETAQVRAAREATGEEERVRALLFSSNAARFFEWLFVRR